MQRLVKRRRVDVRDDISLHNNSPASIPSNNEGSPVGFVSSTAGHVQSPSNSSVQLHGSGMHFDDSALRQYLAARDKVGMETFLRHLSGIHKVVADIHSEISDLNIHMCAMQSEIEILSLKQNALGVSPGVASNGRNDIAHRCDTFLPHFELIFSSDITFRVVLHSIIHILSKGIEICDDHPAAEEMCTDECIGNCTSVQLCSMMFSKRATMGKAVLQSGYGKEYSKMRRLLVLSLVRNAQGNRFGQFQITPVAAERNSTANNCNGAELNAEDTARNRTHSVSITGRIPQPAWIKPSFITGDHVEVVRCKLETKAEKTKGSTSKKRMSDSRPTDGEISLRCIERIYKKVTSHLHTGRERGRTSFFDELGYTMVSWNDHSVPTYIETPKLSWAYPNTMQRVSKISLVPETFVSTEGTHHQDILKNTTILAEFLKKCGNMILVVEHGVNVATCSDLSREDSGEDGTEAHVAEGRHTNPVVKKPLRRMVNLLEVALRFLNAYCGGSLDVSMESVLSNHSNVLRASFAVAATFKILVQSFMTSVGDGHVPYSTNDRNWAQRVCCEDISLSDMLPTPSIRQSTFHKMVLSMSQVDFGVHHMPFEHSVSRRPTSHIDAQGNESDNKDVAGLDFVLC